MSVPLILYHGVDNDGYMSAAIARVAVNRDGKGLATVVPVNYSWETPWEDIKNEQHDPVIIVDFTFQKDNYKEMIEVINTVRDSDRKIVWIDHHASALEAMDKLLNTSVIDGMRKVGSAACELSWQFFFPEVEMPIFVELLGRYDVWDHSNELAWKSEIYPYQVTAKLKRTNPKSSKLFDTVIKDYLVDADSAEAHTIDWIHTGRVLVKQEMATHAKIAKITGIKGSFFGTPAVIANTPIKTSNVLQRMYDKEKVDLMVLWCISSRGIVEISLYSDKIDCASKAANLGEMTGMGGGGHMGAAGFSSSIWWFKENISSFTGSVQ